MLAVDLGWETGSIKLCLTTLLVLLGYDCPVQVDGSCIAGHYYSSKRNLAGKVKIENRCKEQQSSVPASLPYFDTTGILRLLCRNTELRFEIITTKQSLGHGAGKVDLTSVQDTEHCDKER